VLCPVSIETNDKEQPSDERSTVEDIVTVIVSQDEITNDGISIKEVSPM
jgi:hypothetical protein